MPANTEPTVKRGRGRPKGSVKVKSPWFKQYCPICGGEFGAMMKDCEFYCKHDGKLVLCSTKKPSVKK